MIYLYLLLLSLASAQSRYIDPIFEEIQITKNVVYGKASNPPLEGWPSFIEKSIYQTQDIMSEIENIQELIDQLENQANDYFVVNELLEEFDNLKEMLAPVITAEISKALKNIDSINKSMNPKQKKTIKNWNSNIKILKVQLNDMMGSFKMAMADKKFNELVKNIEYFSNNQSNIVDSLTVLSENELQSLLDNQKNQEDRLNNIKISLNEISNIIEAFYPDLSKKIKNIEESSLVFSISKKLDATTLAIQNKNKKLSAANASNVNLKIYNLSIIINESKLLFDKKISKEKIANYQTDLKMDIYEAAADTVSIRPVIIFLHSGAFVAGDKEADVMVELSKEAAKKGYVAVSANYRLALNIHTVRGERALYKAVQDGSAIIRFIREFHKLYRIDPSKVFVWGSSAGAFIGLHLSYFNEKDRPFSTFENSIYPDLGCIDCDGNSYPHSSMPNALVSCWGAIGDFEWIDSDDHVPIILFHGTDDLIVPFNEGFPFTINILLNKVYGSKVINDRLDRTDIIHEMHVNEGGEHEYWGTKRGNWKENRPNQYFYDIQKKSYTFLYNFLEQK